MEAEGIAFLQDNAGKLAPHFDDIRISEGGFGHGMDHGLNLLFGVEMVTIRRLTTAEVAKSLCSASKYRPCGINMAVEFFPRWHCRQHDERMNVQCPFD
jgi:hypothetical protein